MNNFRAHKKLLNLILLTEQIKASVLLVKSVYLRALKSCQEGQFNLAHGTKKRKIRKH